MLNYIYIYISFNPIIPLELGEKKKILTSHFAILDFNIQAHVMHQSIFWRVYVMSLLIKIAIRWKLVRLLNYIREICLIVFDQLKWGTNQERLEYTTLFELHLRM